MPPKSVIVLPQTVLAVLSTALLAAVTVAAETTASGPAKAASAPAAGRLDDSLLREGLRQRGLTDWLQQYLADTPPIDEADAQLRQREKLLESAAEPSVSESVRVRSIEQAHSILLSLLEKYPEHPGRLRWRLETARDLLERLDPSSFNGVLLYELPGRDRGRAHELSDKAVEACQKLRQEIAATWKSVESLDENALQGAVASGSLRVLESLDGQAAFTLAWARFCRLISMDPPPADYKKQLDAMLVEVTTGGNWIQSADPVQRCAALVMAAVTARLAGEYDQAARFALEIVDAYKITSSPQERGRAKTASFLAVIEQIRVLRDRGQADNALSFIDQARQWADKSRPNDVQAALAIALVHRSVLARKLSLNTAPAGGGKETVLKPEEALDPLEQLSRKSPEYRDVLYGVLAGALADETALGIRTPFGVQLLLGTAVADASAARATSQPSNDERLESAISAARAMLGSLPADVLPDVRGEFMYLLGVGFSIIGRNLEAVAVLCDLAEQLPSHDRVARAIGLAAAVAEQTMRGGRSENARSARDAFVRAGRLLCKRLPDSPGVRNLPYLIAVALEQNGQLEAAAETYASVGADNAQALAARVGRARCLRSALDQAIAHKTLGEQETRALADRAIQAAREAAVAAEQQSGDPARHRRLAAETVVLLAGLLSHPTIDKSQEAFSLLEGFETRFADQPEMLGPMLRERVAVLSRLKRFGEARRAAEQLLNTDAESAGPVLAQLLEAMRTEINTAADRDDTRAVQQVAEDATAIANLLLNWSQQRPQRVPPAEVLTVRVWYAWSLQQARRTKEALAIYDTCSETTTRPSTGSPAPLEARLGRAECLLTLGKPTAALPLFAEVWQVAPERSANWWRALAGSLACHTRLEHDPNQIVQSIQQQRTLDPKLGGPRWQRALETIEKTNQARVR